MFQIRDTGRRSVDVKPFNVSIDHKVHTDMSTEFYARRHIRVELTLAVEYRDFPNNDTATAEIELLSKRAIIDKLYGQVLLKLHELERAVYYGDMQLSLQSIKEAQEWIHDLEKN